MTPSRARAPASAAATAVELDAAALPAAVCWILSAVSAVCFLLSAVPDPLTSPSPSQLTVAVIKYPHNTNLRENMLFLAHNSKYVLHRGRN